MNPASRHTRVALTVCLLVVAVARGSDDGRIYFTRADAVGYHVYSIRPDGSDETRHAWRHVAQPAHRLTRRPRGVA